MADTVLVTGGSGYIAGFLIRDLLAQGWTVHTTIRDLAKEAEVRALLGGSADRLKLFAADLTADPGWAEAVAGCSHVAHVASPFPPTTPRHDDELIVPARDGVLRVLRAARNAGVRRFVQTSSIAAIAYGHGQTNRAFTESDWTNLAGNSVYAYTKSKTIAERAARDWVAAEGGGIEFVSVNPSAVIGPITNGVLSTSIELVRQFLAGAMPGVPDFGVGVVDVRDVSEAHILALTTPGLAGERFLTSGPFTRLITVAQILKAGLSANEARKVPTRLLPNWLVRLAGRFNPVVRQISDELGKVTSLDASHARAVLGWSARPVEESVLDCARSLIDQGIVKL